MALQSHQRRKKPLLYSDLFKCSASLEENTSLISSSSTQSSSSSGFSTPMQCSDLEVDEDGDFIAELTRQMTECMLEEEENEKVLNCVSEESQISQNKEHNYLDHGNNLKCGFKSGRVCVDHGIPPIQVYELKNQPAVTKRIDGSESAQQKQHYMQYRGRNGSGMQAVFLGSRKMPAGTGVFLPQVPTHPTRQKNKSAGCSMVLMPTRVLQALDLHFKQRHYPSSGGSQLHSCPKACADESLEKEVDEIQLPQEWSY